MNKDGAIRELSELLDKLKEFETIGFDIEGAGEIVIKDYKSRGYSKAGKFTDVENVYLEKQDHVAPEQTDISTVAKIIETMILIIKEEGKPEPSKLRKLLSVVAPMGSWANLMFSILQKYGIL
jgi:hypothetical protein